MSYSETGLLELAPKVFAVITSIIPPEGGGPNAGFVLTGDKVVVVDSLMSPRYGQELLKYLKEVTDKPPTYLINTHNHGDHIFGNQALSPPAIIIGHEKVREFLLSQGQKQLRSFVERFSDLAPDIKETKLLAPQITFKDRLRMHFNGNTIELIHPGVAHSHGDTMIYLPDMKILFAGDILFNKIFPPIFGSSAGWIAAIELVEEMDVETIIPGHGFIATKEDLRNMKQCLVELRSQARECFTRGLSCEQAVNEIDIPFLEWPHNERLTQDVGLIY
jgi:cyclase